MNLQFNINYQTSFGEDLILNLIDKNAKDGITKYRMNTLDGMRWTCELRREEKLGSALTYYYSVERNGSETQHEWLVEPHKLEISSHKGERYITYDHCVRHSCAAIIVLRLLEHRNFLVLGSCTMQNRWLSISATSGLSTSRHLTCRA